MGRSPGVVSVLGHIWLPHVQAAASYVLSSCDVVDIREFSGRGKITIACMEVRNRSMLKPKDYQNALDVQDACNLSGVVHSLACILDKIWDEATSLGEGTAYVNQHPIVQLYVDKLADLARVRTMDAYSTAYRVVHMQAREELCECSDSGCPVHPGVPSCDQPMSGKDILYRSDMEDNTGTLMCEKCADDAWASGLFTYEGRVRHE